MQSNIARWGNSLAVRLPAEQIKTLGLSEGAAVEVNLTAAGEIRITPVQPFDKAAFIAHLKTIQSHMPESNPVVEILRGQARY
jgi:antitoxin MazE